MFFDEFPYTNLHNVNLDWVLQKVKEWGEMVEDNNQRFEDLQTAYEAFRDWLTNDYNNFKDYVTSYLENLDVQEEINNKLDEMLRSGELTPYLQPYIVTEVENWLQENITPTTPLVDSTLSVAGAAADAKATGDAIREMEQTVADTVLSNLNDLYRNMDNILVKSNTLTFAQGSINPATGADITTGNGIRTNNFITEDSGIVCIKSVQPYKFKLYCFDSNDTYLGCLEKDGTLKTSDTGLYDMLGILWNDAYKYKVVLFNPGSTIAVSESVNCLTCFISDDTLTLEHKAADAATVGRNIANFYLELPSISFERGAIRVQDGTIVDNPRAIRSTDFIEGNSGVILSKLADERLSMRVYAFDEAGTYLGVLNLDGTLIGSSGPWPLIHECFMPWNPTYKYKYVLYKDNDATIVPIEDGESLKLYCFKEKEVINEALKPYGIDISTGKSNALYAADPVLVAPFDTIFDENDATPGIDDRRYNYLNVIKISDSMFYMYYEAFSISDGAVDYPGARLCFAYSTDGLNFTKDFPSGITNPGYGANMIMPKGTTHGQCIAKVPDNNYPFRMIASQGTDPDRICKMYKSQDGVNWTFMKQISQGYNDSPSSLLVRGNLLKIYLRTRDANGRAVGVFYTDLDGNRVYPGWSEQISMNDITRQMYNSAASIIDDRRELLLPTLYNPAAGTDPEGLVAMIVNGSVVSVKELDANILWNTGEKSFYIAPGIINIGFKYYVYYVVHYAGHDDASTPGMTGSAIRRIEIQDASFVDVVRP